MPDVSAGRPDEVIVADLFRLARSGRFKYLAELLHEAEELYPDEPPERIKACALKLGEILWRADYQGYCCEYRRHHRRKR